MITLMIGCQFKLLLTRMQSRKVLLLIKVEKMLIPLIILLFVDVVILVGNQVFIKQRKLRMLLCIEFVNRTKLIVHGMLISILLKEQILSDLLNLTMFTIISVTPKLSI